MSLVLLSEIEKTRSALERMSFLAKCGFHNFPPDGVLSGIMSKSVTALGRPLNRPKHPGM